jgi:hypothetical protein
MKKLLARPILSAAASFVGIFAGELARSRTSCQYVEASRKINTTLMRRKRKYLHRVRSVFMVALQGIDAYFFISEYSTQLRAWNPCR